MDAVRVWALDQLALLVRSASLLKGSTDVAQGVARFAVKFFLVHGHFAPSDAVFAAAAGKGQKSKPAAKGKAKKAPASVVESEDGVSDAVAEAEAELSALIIAPQPAVSDRVRSACSVRLFAALKDLLMTAANPRHVIRIPDDDSATEAAVQAPVQADPAKWSHVTLQQWRKLAAAGSALVVPLDTPVEDDDDGDDDEDDEKEASGPAPRASETDAFTTLCDLVDGLRTRVRSYVSIYCIYKHVLKSVLPT